MSVKPWHDDLPLVDEGEAQWPEWIISVRLWCQVVREKVMRRA